MKLIFLHIPKAGGTTFHKILQDVYEGKRIHSIRVNKGRLTTSEFLQMPDKEDVFLLKGHMDFGLHNAFNSPVDVQYVTFLRDPVSRMRSHYHYVLKDQGHYLHKMVVDANMTFIQYALSDISSELDNGQVRMISGVGGDVEITEIHLQMAIQNIEAYFSVVGLTERYNESLVLMADKLGWDRIPEYSVLRQGKVADQMAKEDIQKVRDRNRFDLRLYDYSSRRFDTELSRVVDLDRKIEEIRIKVSPKPRFLRALRGLFR